LEKISEKDKEEEEEEGNIDMKTSLDISEWANLEGYVGLQFSEHKQIQMRNYFDERNQSLVGKLKISVWTEK